MAIGWFRGSIAATLMSLIPGCEFAEWNQKMTVVVATPEGERTGSSIINVWYSSMELTEFYGRGWGWEVEGEAVVVDLGARGALLALLSRYPGSPSDAGRNASYTFNDMSYTGAGDDKAIAGVLNQPKGEAVEVAPRFYPMLVTYSDLNDPTTIAIVDPNDLAATFGTGVRLERITLETTDEPVSPSRLKGLLPCYTTHRLCAQTSRDLPYGHPLYFVPNDAFWSTN